MPHGDLLKLSRRSVLAGLGGLTFYIAFSRRGLRLAQASETVGGFSPSPWVRIAPDGTTTIMTITEMGQGSSNAIPLILAEEMDADWSKVRLAWAPADAKVFGWPGPHGPQMAISGSRAVMMYYDDLRLVGAQIRKIMILNAAKKWGLQPSGLRTAPGVVVNPDSKARLTYGEIAAFASLPKAIPAVRQADLKPRHEFRLIGTSHPRLDIPSKVNGSAQFSIDVKLPGMAFATAKHSQGMEPDQWNATEIQGMPGVLSTLKLVDGVAVAAETYEQAIAARAALKVRWRPGKASGYNSEQALQDYVEVYERIGAPTKTIEATGDVETAFAKAAKVGRADYLSDYAYHAQMEPLNAAARFSDGGDRLEIWLGSQNLGASLKLVARSLSMKPEQVTLHQCYLGGAFGRRSDTDYAVEAALVARAVNRPVKLIWTREEDVARGMFRPQSYQRLEAALDRKGMVVAWRHGAVGEDGGENLVAGGMKISSYYQVPNRRLELRSVSSGVYLAHWRAVAHNFNLFAIEGFVDELATGQDMDPVEFRLRSMNLTPRAKAALERAVTMSDWKSPRPKGRALGFAITNRSGSLGAGVVEISLDHKTSRIRVHSVWLAIDGGTIVTPEAALANVESGLSYGLSSALKERITFEDGVVQQSNFQNYPVLRMAEAPENVTIEFLASESRPTGIGEIGTPFVAPAVANAFAKLTGKRLYHMPFTPQRVREALSA